MRLPVVTRALLASVIALSTIVELFRIYRMALTYEDGPANVDAYYLVLILGKTPAWSFPITLVTTCFVETRLVPFLILVIILATGGRYLEKVWGPKEYVTFSMVMLFGMTLLELFIYMVLEAPEKYPLISGANGLVAGITVGLKQLVPAHTVVFFRGRLRVPLKWAPVIFLVAVTLLATVGLEENLIAYYGGFIASWLWLRFVMEDGADAFSFAAFFPQPLRQWLEPVTEAIYKVSVRSKLLTPLSPELIELSNQRYAARLTGTLPPVLGVQATNERRRAMLGLLTTDDRPLD